MSRLTKGFNVRRLSKKVSLKPTTRLSDGGYVTTQDITSNEDLETTIAELEKAQAELEDTHKKMMESDGPASMDLEMAYETQAQKLEMLESKVKQYDDMGNNKSLHLIQHSLETEPELHFLELYGYDSFIFKDIYKHGRAKLIDEETEKETNIYLIICDKVHRGLYVLDDQYSRANKKVNKKGSLLKPIHVIRFEGAILKVGGDGSFSISVRVPVNKNIYGDKVHRSSVSKRKMEEFSFETDSAEIAKAWVFALQEGISSGSVVQADVRVVHTVSICIKSATITNQNTIEAYMNVLFGGEQQGRSPTIKSSKGELDWMHTFHFDNIPTNIDGITFELVQKRSLKKSSLGTCWINSENIKTMATDSPHGKWFDLNDTNDEKIGRIMIQCSFQFQRILPLETYESLTTRLRDMVNTDTDQMKSMLKSIEEADLQLKTALGINLLRFYISQRLHVKFLCLVAELEIAEGQSAKTLFRANSIFSKTFDFFLNFLGNGYLRETIGEVVSEIVHEKWTVEIDPTIVTSKSALTKNWEIMKEVTIKLLDNIFNSTDKLPLELRFILHTVKKATITRFEKEKDELPDFDATVLLSVTAFLFLRFFSAALLSPTLEPFNLTDQVPSPVAKRTLTLVSKIVQKISNLIEFTESDGPFMPANDIFKEKDYLAKMRMYLHEVSSIKDNENEFTFDFIYDIDLARVCAKTNRCFADIKLKGIANEFIDDIISADFVPYSPKYNADSKPQSRLLQQESGVSRTHTGSNSDDDVISGPSRAKLERSRSRASSCGGAESLKTGAGRRKSSHQLLGGGVRHKSSDNLFNLKAQNESSTNIQSQSSFGMNEQVKNLKRVSISKRKQFGSFTKKNKRPSSASVGSADEKTSVRGGNRDGRKTRSVIMTGGIQFHNEAILVDDNNNNINNNNSKNNSNANNNNDNKKGNPNSLDSQLDGMFSEFSDFEKTEKNGNSDGSQKIKCSTSHSKNLSSSSNSSIRSGKPSLVTVNQSTKEGLSGKGIKELKNILSGLCTLHSAEPKHCLTKEDLVDEILRFETMK